MQAQRGRPTKSEQLQINGTLREHYLRGLTATATAQLTGIDIKTVTKYFDGFYTEQKEFQKKNFLQRQEEEHHRIIICYDFLMAEELENYDTIKDEIERARRKGETVPQYLLNKRSESIRTIAMLNEKRGLLAMSPQLDEEIRELVKEMICDVKK